MFVCLIFVQAFFRLCRIVYSTNIWLQYFWLYIILPFIELILVCVLFIPLLVWDDIVYLPSEHYCYVPYTNIRGILWIILNAYGNPVLLLSIIYVRISMFLRQQSTNQIVVVHQRQVRDLLVLRRILITVCLLLALGIPSVILLSIFIITSHKQPLFFRIEWLSVSLSMIGLSLSQVIFTPQLKRIVLKIFQYNRV